MSEDELRKVAEAVRTALKEVPRRKDNRWWLVMLAPLVVTIIIAVVGWTKAGDAQIANAEHKNIETEIKAEVDARKAEELARKTADDAVIASIKPLADALGEVKSDTSALKAQMRILIGRLR
jgi:hypothetical protein